MRTKLYFVAALAATMLASCADDKFVGDNSPNELQENAGVGINFGLNLPGRTRADIYGGAAAKLLGNNFYVMGTKGTEDATSPSPTLVFDNYLVNYKANSAGTQEDNTANWEYVGVTPGTGDYSSHQKLSNYSEQTIKYWDYSADQYDFFAFSTGTKKAMKDKTSPASDEIGVTAMAHGTALAGGAYTLYIPSVEALKEAYITDIKEVKGTSNYGKEVQLQFKNIGAKLRVALYETVPGYSVKDVKFYDSESTPIDHTQTGTYVAPTENATLISANAKGFPTSGSIAVSFPYIGNNNQDAQAYDKASATVGVTTGVQTQQFGALTNQLKTRIDHEDETATPDKLYLGRSLPEATFAGSEITGPPAFASTEDAQFYQAVFPVSTSYSLTLRVDYTLVSLDGSKEEIKVYGATAVVPAKYTVWQPNYAYTYIFKISDKTNGWTNEAKSAQGLFPITFDAVVAEFNDAEDQQKTITTVATPSITTYQQYHDITKDEYSRTVKNLKNEDVTRDIYVRIINNEGNVVSSLSANNSLIYLLNRDDASEAEVMDALLMRKTAVGEVSTVDVKGRNGLVLTNKHSNIDNDDTKIVNGVDDKPIDVATGTVAKITISTLTPGKSYAYVYISKAVTPSTGEVNQYEPVSVTVDSPIDNTRADDDFYTLTTINITAGTTLSSAEEPDDAYLYFSVTENGTGITTYSYISPLGKTTIPKDCKKVAKSTLEGNTKAKGSANAAANTFYFDKYITNDGEYAVKVIKIAAES
jgi:hypothetical protein